MPRHPKKESPIPPELMAKSLQELDELSKSRGLGNAEWQAAVKARDDAQAFLESYQDYSYQINRAILEKLQEQQDQK